MKFSYFENKSNLHRVMFHILFWICDILFFSSVQSVRVDVSFWNTVVENIPFLSTDMFATYATIYFIMPRYLYTKQYIKFGLAWGALAIITIFLIQTVHYFVFIPIFHPELFFTFNFFKINYFYFLVSSYSVVTLAMAIKLTKYWYLEQTQRTSLVNKNLKSELALMRSQINPKFLFDSLKQINFLIEKDEQKASDSISKLSAILRHILYETNTELVPLDSELDNLKNYIQLHSLKFTNCDLVKIDFSNIKKNYKITPLLFEPIIDYGFQVCEKSKNCTSFTVKLNSDENSICFTLQIVADQVAEINTDAKETFQKRLNLVYAGMHNLSIENNKNKFNVSLIITQL